LDKSVTARRKAQQLAREGHLGQAIQEMDRVLLAGDADPYDFVFHGDLLVRGHRLDDAVTSYDEAISAYERVGLYRNAIAIGKKILRSDPHRARTFWRLGDLYAKEGLIGDAVSHFLTFLDHAGGEATSDEFLETLERIAGLCGPKVELALRLSDLYVRAGRSERAARLLEEVADQAAGGGAVDIAQSLREKGIQLRKEAEEVENQDGTGAPLTAHAGEGFAESVFSQAYALEPVDREQFAFGAPMPDGIEPQADEVSPTPDQDPEEAALSAMGRTISLVPAEEEESLGEGIVATPALQETPAPEEPPLNEAEIDPRRVVIEDAIGKGEWEKALALAQELREELLDDPWPIEKLIAVSRQLGDTLATIRHLTLMGDLLITQEDLEGSLACFREILMLDPENGTARRRLARFREMKVPGAEEAPAEGEFPIRQTLVTQGATVTVRENGGVESQEWIDLAALLDEFRDGIRAQYRPEDYAGHYDLGVSHLEMGLYEEAIEEFDLVLSADSLPKDVAIKAREMRGNSLQRLERFREAIHEYRRALDVDGIPEEDRAPVRYQLACALERAGDLEEARTIFRDLAVEPGQGYPDSREHLERLGG
jgi:tetratricopeptide (TPR) repeat protein